MKKYITWIQMGLKEVEIWGTKFQGGGWDLEEVYLKWEKFLNL